MSENVTSIWANFRGEQYYWCTKLTTAVNEVMPEAVTSLWASFRYRQYCWCSSLTIAAVEALPSALAEAWSQFRREQYLNCSMTTFPRIINVTSTQCRQQFAYLTYTTEMTCVNDVMSERYSVSWLSKAIVKVPNEYLQNYKDSTLSPWKEVPDENFVWY